MKEICIVSGKGGTGKTSITAALASIGSGMVFCDCDVDAADLHLLLQPEIKEKHVFEGAWCAEINPEKCSDCQKCAEYCSFEAIFINNSGNHEIDPFKCEGCRLCERICPDDAIRSHKSRESRWFVSDTRHGPMVHARMGPGEDSSGKLVSLVREKAREIARKKGQQFVITDGPPGTGCASIASITGSDAVLLVMEPSLSSLSDAERLIKLVRIFKIPLYALINKCSISPTKLEQIKHFLKINDIPLLAEIPFDKSITEAMIHGLSIMEYHSESVISKSIRWAWNTISKAVSDTE